MTASQSPPPCYTYRYQTVPRHYGTKQSTVAARLYSSTIRTMKAFFIHLLNSSFRTPVNNPTSVGIVPESKFSSAQTSNKNRKINKAISTQKKTKNE
jgi:hypothetical protein